MNARNFARTQLLLQSLPILNRHQVPMRVPERPAQQSIGDPEADFNFFRQKYHAVFKEPAGNVFFAVESVAIKSEINLLIPLLKQHGAEDILEIPISKIVA